jgi:hypothetical protein
MRDIKEVISRMLEVINEQSEISVYIESLIAGLEDIRLRVDKNQSNDLAWGGIGHYLSTYMLNSNDPESPEWTREVAALFVGKTYIAPVTE